MASRKSGLSKKTNQRRNTKGGRKAMSKSSFALPGRRAYRMDDLPHARNALARAAQNESKATQKTIRARVTKKWPSLKKSGTGRRRKKKG